jgi:hypothetical protein
MEALIAWGLTTLGGSFIGSYLASYLRKKGENLATHEDLDKLVDQVRAVTTTTKEIEAQISTDVWARQKRWEMKRDVLFEATKLLGRVEDSLTHLNSAFLAERMGEPVSLDAKSLAIDRWTDESRNFEEASLLVAIVCRKETKNACDNYRLFARKIAVGVFQHDSEILLKSIPELVEKSAAILMAIRKELDSDNPT